MRYYRLTHGLVDKGRIISEKDDITKLVKRDKDNYLSLYYYPPSIVDYFKANGRSIKGYKGEAFSDYLVFDIDSDDLEVSRENMKRLINYLASIGIYRTSCSQISFSGSKGYHLFIQTEYPFTPPELKKFCLFLASKVRFIRAANFKIDPSIYNTTRPFRIINTLNQKSGLYKISLSERMLFALHSNKIKEIAQEPQKAYYAIDKIKREVVDKYLEESQAYKFRNNKKQIKFTPKEIEKVELDLEQYPCYNAIQGGDIAPGESNSCMLRLASLYYNNGYSMMEIREKLAEAASHRENHYPDANEIDEDKIDYEILSCIDGMEAAYRYGKTDDILRKKCDKKKKCLLHNPPKKKGDNMSFGSKVKFGSKKKITTAKEIREDKYVENNNELLAQFGTTKETSVFFDKIAKNPDEYIIKTSLFGEKLQLLVGDFTMINARPSVGKTTLVYPLMEDCCKAGMHGLYYCADMSDIEDYRKRLSRHIQISPQDVLLWQQKTMKKDKDAILDEIDKKYDKFYTCFEQEISLELIKQHVNAFRKDNKDIRVVIIDYVQKMKDADNFEKQKKLATGLKKTAKDLGIHIIALSQIPRGHGANAESMPMYNLSAASGGTHWEATASNSINLWRPFKELGYTKDRHNSNGHLVESDKVLAYYIAKNRMGETCESAWYFDGRVSTIEALTDQEYRDYKENVAMIDQARMQQKVEQKRNFNKK
jgi:hypothetical protein